MESTFGVDLVDEAGRRAYWSLGGDGLVIGVSGWAGSTDTRGGGISLSEGVETASVGGVMGLSGVCGSSFSGVFSSAQWC